MRSSNVYITGFSGTGKTTVSSQAARRLGWRFVDIDDEIVGEAGRSIETVFREEGESHFRELERRALSRVSEGERQVVSTGGGIVMDDGNRRVMERTGVVICLEARADTIHRRLSRQRDQSQGPAVRPLLAADDPLRRIVELKDERQPYYSLAHWTVHTDTLTPGEAADEVVRAWRMLATRADDGLPRQPPGQTAGGADDMAAMVTTASGEYPVWVGWGILDELGQRVKRRLSPGAAYVIADEGVDRQALRAQASLEAAGIPAHMFLVPSGERSKSLETVQHLYGWLAGLRAERGHLVVAVGGGMVGDLAGFAAATFMRGVPLGQVPTSLLAMMDAAVGGKTAVDLPQGKNLVGAFHQPRFVLEDVQMLESLPARELTAGWAEAIKHGLILDERLLRTFETERKRIASLDREATTDVIRRSVAVKARVVSRDEKETLGLRMLLNYGHTIGHALEAATGYERFLHGEAVSVGMMGASLISQWMGLLSEEEVVRQRDVLQGYGLPVSYRDVDAGALLDAMALDKKTAGGAIAWVLLDGIGNAVTRSDVPAALVGDAIQALRS